MKIANQYENCKAILMFRCMVPTWTLQFSYERHSGIENLFRNEFLSWIVAWTKNSREQSLAKPSTIHILILIPVRRQLSDDSSALKELCGGREGQTTYYVLKRKDLRCNPGKATLLWIVNQKFSKRKDLKCVLVCRCRRCCRRLSVCTYWVPT